MDENIKRKFTDLIEYQKKDIELRKLNNVLDRDEALVSMNKNKRAFNDAKQTISDCEQEAGVLVEQYAELVKYIQENEAALAEFENDAEVDDEEELEQRSRRLESLKSKFQSADKKMHDIEDKSKGVCSRRADAIKTGNAAKQKFAEAREKHGKLVGSMADNMNKLKAELDERQKTLDPELFAEYQKLVEDNKFPPVVPAAGDDKKNLYNCGGCGLNLPQKGNAMLNDRGWCRCDNCRRIIVHLK